MRVEMVMMRGMRKLRGGGFGIVVAGGGEGGKVFGYCVGGRRR